MVFFFYLCKFCATANFLQFFSTVAAGDAAASAAVAAGDVGGGWGVPRPAWACLASRQFFLKLRTNLNLVNRFWLMGLTAVNLKFFTFCHCTFCTEGWFSVG